MVIVRLAGGLGNQMFQYAFARRTALENGVPLKLDVVSGFRNDFYGRKYSLNHFNILEDTVTDRELKRIARTRSPSLVGKCHRLVNRLRPRGKSYILRECTFADFDLSILKGYEHIYIDGYWQSERFFQSIEEVIRRELSVKSPLEGANLEIANRIATEGSVSVHLRRLHGVSVSGEVDRAGVNLHGATSLEYYHRAVEYLRNRQGELHLFVFSDNPEWAEENFHVPHPTTFVSHNRGDQDYEDLRLMTLCKHHIIANSSFSWWGAWLCENPQKSVIAPKKWFNDPSRYTHDLVPDRWHRI